jgi:hypothetical protein
MVWTPTVATRAAELLPLGLRAVEAIQAPWRKRSALSQETSAKLNLDAKHFLQLLEGYAPTILEVTYAVSQQLEKAALSLDAKHLLQLLEGSGAVVLDVTHAVLQQLEKATPTLVAMAQIDWASLKRAMDELPEKSKAAMILASSKGWYFGWNDELARIMHGRLANVA